MKKTLLALATSGAVIAALPMFAAFEAHVVNVTATIENALNVDVTALDFGTVFPQEKLEKTLNVVLSQSFKDENRVDDVEYFIRQKPKCGVTTLDGQSLVEGSTETGHVVVGDNPDTQEVEAYWIDCGRSPVEFNAQTHKYGLLPLLCPYISKHPDGVNDAGAPVNNDGSMNSFHVPFEIVNNAIDWNDTPGHLAKSEGDTTDKWTIDLAVPCFGNYCAQDWEEFVDTVSGDPATEGDDYTQPIANEHKVFGCDLWIEVGGISLPGLGCKGKIDLMMVVDESGSIGEPNMSSTRTALHAFIDALVLATDGPNAGQTSFALAGSLDQQLTDNEALVHAAIDTLVSGGSTNLTAGIDLAQQEFDSVRDRADAPNIMLVVTDGVPNVCLDGNCDTPNEAENEAAAEAAAAIADGTEIFVVGIGGGVNTTYLTNEIASTNPPTHYFAGDFGTLQTTLLDLVSCE